MTLTVDVFWSFRSPYSYLATSRLVEIARRFTVDLRVRPVLPIAIRTPAFFEQQNPLWVPYLLRDTFRLAEYLGLPYGWPQPDPVVQEFPSRQIAAEQPYIHRLTRLGVEAGRRGHGLAFVDEVSRVIWGGVAGWHEGTHLADAARRAGIDLAALDAAIAEPADHDATIAANQEALQVAGHWGVPTMVFAGEAFFGQDRIDLLLWRLRQHGLTER
jgi:2-hydroxychromene-2-carboxylate isomerase